MRIANSWLLGLACVVFSLGCGSASELTLSLAQKVTKSDLVAIVRVKNIASKELASPGHQMMTFTLEVGEVVKGKVDDKNIVLREYSRNATATFSGSWIQKESLFLAYLKLKQDGTYTLTGSSNQYFEDITEKKVLFVRDVGQTVNTVTLDEKISKLRALVTDSKKVEQGAPPKSDRAGG